MTQEENLSGKTVFVPRTVGTIHLMGREIIKVMLADDKGYVVVNSLAEAFGFQPKSLRRRLTRNRKYFDPYIAIVKVKRGVHEQDTMCLMAAAVPLFLTGSDIDQIEDEESQRVFKYFLDHTMDVLAEHFGISEKDEMAIMRDQWAQMILRHEGDDAGLSEKEAAKKLQADLTQLRQEQGEKVQQIRQAFSGLRDDIRAFEHKLRRLSAEPLGSAEMGDLRTRIDTLASLLIGSGVNKPYPGIYMDITRMTGFSKLEDNPRENYQLIRDLLDNQIQALNRQQQQNQRRQESREYYIGYRETRAEVQGAPRSKEEGAAWRWIAENGDRSMTVFEISVVPCE